MALPRPASVTRPALALVAVSFALFGIARTTGSGWLIVILTIVAATVFLSAVLPPFGLLRTTVEVTAPRDGTVGREIELAVRLAGGSRAVKLRAAGFESRWTGAQSPCDGLLAVTPVRRGVVDTVELEVRSAAPIGLVWWARRWRLPLATQLEVGPHPLDVDAPAPQGDGTEGADGRHLVAVAVDAVRGTREYTAGDPIKLVHWMATARFGELMVKELEAAASPALAVAVDLRGEAAAVERAASRAAGVCNAALRLGVPVVVLTHEAAGGVAGAVGSPREVGRRLARATGGPPPPPPPGTTVVSVSAGDER